MTASENEQGPLTQYGLDAIDLMDNEGHRCETNVDDKPATRGEAHRARLGRNARRYSSPYDCGTEHSPGISASCSVPLERVICAGNELQPS